MKAFKLVQQKQSEGQVQADLLDALWYEVRTGRVIWYGRFNCGRLWRKGSDKGMYASIRYWFRGWIPEDGETDGRTSGWPDIVGQLADGRFFAFEVKAPGKGANKKQRQILDIVRVGGGVSAVVDSWEAGVQVIREAKDE